MDDPEAKRSLADDPSFAASLGDLDRGLESDGGNATLTPSVRAASPSRPPHSTAAQPAPPRHTSTAPPRPAPPARAPFEAAPLPPFVREPGSRRPLLDLFPPVPLAHERPPGPIVGTATGPSISRSPAKRSPQPAALDPLTYETFYGLDEKPFSLSTDPKFLYHSASHDQVAQELLTAIRRHDGLVLITGEFGVGKTTLCRAVTEELDRRTLTSVVLEPLTSIDDLLRTVLVDFGVISHDDLARAPQAATREALTATLKSFLASLNSLQASAVVIIDEAQQLPVDVLQQMPTIAEAGDKSRTLQVVLVGQPTLTAMLKRSELRLLNEEVAVRSRLGPLAADEIVGYVMLRLGVAGRSPRVDFDDGAMARVHELSGGIPRVVNLLCDRALSRGFEASASVIDAALVDAAAEDLDLGQNVSEVRGLVRWLLAAVALVALMCAGAGGALWVFRDTVTRTIVQWEGVPVPPSGPLRSLPGPLAPLPAPADAGASLQAPPVDR